MKNQIAFRLVIAWLLAAVIVLSTTGPTVATQSMNLPGDVENRPNGFRVMM